MANAESQRIRQAKPMAGSPLRFRDQPFEDAQFEDVGSGASNADGIIADTVSYARSGSKPASAFEAGSFGRKPALEKSAVADDTLRPIAPSQDTVSPKNSSKDAAKLGMSVFARSGDLAGDPSLNPDSQFAFYAVAGIVIALSLWISVGLAAFNRTDPITTASLNAAEQSGQAELVNSTWRLTGENANRALTVEGIVRNPGLTGVHAGPVIVKIEFDDGSRRTFSLGREGWTLAPGNEILVSGRLDIDSKAVASVTLSLTR
jgi:hypothetical protein